LAEMEPRRRQKVEADETLTWWFRASPFPGPDPLDYVATGGQQAIHIRIEAGIRPPPHNGPPSVVVVLRGAVAVRSQKIEARPDRHLYDDSQHLLCIDVVRRDSSLAEEAPSLKIMTRLEARRREDPPPDHLRSASIPGAHGPSGLAK